MLSQLNLVDAGFILFCIFVGTAYKLFVPSKIATDTGIAAKIYTQFLAMVLLGIVGTFLLLNTGYHPLVIGGGGLLASLGGGNLIRLTAEFFDKPDNLMDFMSRVSQAVSAIYKIFTARDDTKP